MLDSDLSSINDAWATDQPGHGCNMETLRWYVIREVGELRQHAKAADKVINNHHVRMEIMKMKLAQETNKEDIDKHMKCIWYHFM